MNNPRTVFADLAAGTELPELRVTVSAAANERYWTAAGVDHPALRAGALYPPIAANMTVLCFGQVCPDAMIQTRQVLRCHRRAQAGSELVTTGRVTDRYEKRGRQYVDVVCEVRTGGELLWTSEVSFTPAAGLERSDREAGISPSSEAGPSGPAPTAPGAEA